jgi:hypothetical protein
MSLYASLWTGVELAAVERRFHEGALSPKSP